MLPHFSFLGRVYPTYGILGIIGLFLAVIVAGFRVKRYGLVRSDPIYMGAFAGFGLIAGGTLLYAITQLPLIIQNSHDFTGDFIALVTRLFGGMVFYGGLIGAIFGLYLYSRFMKVPFEVTMKLTVPVLPLAHSVMRVGCFAAGCCHGIAHPPPLGIAFTNALGAPNGIPLLPVQLYEAAANLVIFAILWVYTRKDRSWVILAAVYGLLYSSARFALEFLRGDVIRGFVFGMSTSQFISIILFSVCIIALCLYGNAKRQESMNAANLDASE